MAFTFFLLLAPQALFPALGQFRLALLAAAVAIAGHLLYAVTRQRPIIVLGREVKSAAGLLGLAILSIPFSYWPGGSLSTLVDLYLKSLIIFWLLGSVIISTQRLRQVAWGLSLMTVPLARPESGTTRTGTLSLGVSRGSNVSRVTKRPLPRTPMIWPPCSPSCFP